jgi:hypothetical protein
MEAKDADLLVDVTYEIREDPIDRRRWRQYACAALSGMCSEINFEGGCLNMAARLADEMLALEKARFDGGSK